MKLDSLPRLPGEVPHVGPPAVPLGVRGPGPRSGARVGEKADTQDHQTRPHRRHSTLGSDLSQIISSRLSS